MTKINRLRSFVNLVPCHALLMVYKMNILPVFDYGSIIYDNCSDYDNRMLDKAQLSAAKIILGCLKTTSSNHVPADRNLTSLNLRRKISLLCYVSKLILIWYPALFVPLLSDRSKNLFRMLYVISKMFKYHFLKNLCPITSSSIRLPACGTLYHWK